MKEQARRRTEQIKADAEHADRIAKAAVKRLGLKRGILLVATPKMRGFFTMSVVLILEVDDAYARGIVINGGPGGRTGLGDRTVFHSCVELASEPSNPVVGGTELFAEDFLSKGQAEQVIARLEARGEPFAKTQGCTWWRLEQIVTDIQGGDWATLGWGTAGWWLSVRSCLTTRTLWRRAMARVETESR